MPGWGLTSLPCSAGAGRGDVIFLANLPPAVSRTRNPHSRPYTGALLAYPRTGWQFRAGMANARVDEAPSKVVTASLGAGGAGGGGGEWKGQAGQSRRAGGGRKPSWPSRPVKNPCQHFNRPGGGQSGLELARSLPASVRRLGRQAAAQHE